jgi:hypothetical protein
LISIELKFRFLGRRRIGYKVFGKMLLKKEGSNEKMAIFIKKGGK